MKKDYSEYQPSEHEKYHYWHGNSKDARFDYFNNTVSFDSENKSIRIRVDSYKEEIFLREEIEEDEEFQQQRLGIEFRQESEDPDYEEYRRDAVAENKRDYEELCQRYQINREVFERELGFWYDFHHEEKQIPQNNVLSGTRIELQYGEGILDFIYADFQPHYKKAMDNIMFIKALAQIVHDEKESEDDLPEESSVAAEKEMVYNRTQEVVSDYFKYASTCSRTEKMSYCSLYSAICPPVFESEAVSDKALKRYYRYLALLQNEYRELLEFCFDEAYFPDVLGHLHPAERYRLYRSLHNEPTLSSRSEIFHFNSKGMSGREMPYGLKHDELLPRLTKHQNITEQHAAFAKKYGLGMNELMGSITLPHFLHVEYEFHSVADILDLEFTKLLESKVRFRKCGRCGRYFIMKGNYDTRYCERIVKGTNRTCQDVAAQENYQKKNEGNHAVHIYNKYYKRYHARVGVKQIREDDFKKWKYQAIIKRDECSAGQITVDEYIDWMEAAFTNRQRKK